MSSLALSGSDFGPGDPKIEQAIEKRRQMEAERLKRIKDPKARSMGIDTGALAAQVAEKQNMNDAAKKLNADYDEARLAQDAQLCYLETERIRAEKQKLKYLDDFRATEQGVSRTREFDLYDPEALRKDLPARTDDADPRLSVSGMQQFVGEDLSYAHRIKTQQAELKAWNDEAVANKEAQKAKEKSEKEADETRAKEMDALKTHLETTAASARRDANKAIAEYQLAQAQAKRDRERAQQVQDLQANMQEVQTNLAGDLLTENPMVGRSCIAPNRVRPDCYKGFSPETQQAILMEQEAQRAQNAAKKAVQKAEEAEIEAQLESMRRLGAYSDAKVAEKRAELRKQLASENQALAQEQNLSKSFLDTEIYSNAIEPSFFDQFNTTSR